MSRLQSYILWAGAAILLTFLLFPPYYVPGGLYQLGLSNLAGGQGVPEPHIIQYSFLFLPPAGSTSILWFQYLIPQLVVALFTFRLVNIVKARMDRVVQTATQPSQSAV